MKLSIIQKIIGIIIAAVTLIATCAISFHTEDRYQYLIILSVISGLVIAVTYILINKLINEPLEALLTATQKIALGDTTYKLPIDRQDEIGHFARSFAGMIETIKHTTVDKNQMMQILENMVSSVITISPEMTIETVNGATCAILGFSREELIGKPMTVLFGKQENEQRVPEHIVQWVNKNGFIFGMEENFVSKFDREIPVVISASAMREKDGRLKSIICVAVHNTQRKRIENQLRQTNKELISNETKLKEAFLQVQQANRDLKQTQAQLLQNEKLASLGHLAAGIAHEINNPVAFINNNLEVLDEYNNKFLSYFKAIEQVKKAIRENSITYAQELLGDLSNLEEQMQLDFISKDIDDLLKESLSGTERIRKIVTDLKTFARADGEKMDYVSIEPVLDSITSIVNNEIKYKAQLVKKYSTTSKISINPQRVGQVFINLIINAAQAINSQSGVIEVSNYEQDGFVCVGIKDNGCGIPEENLKHIFDPFFTTKPVGQGTGLGLSISYDIMKKHGGSIDVTSVVGEGTTFIVKFPVKTGKEEGV